MSACLLYTSLPERYNDAIVSNYSGDEAGQHPYTSPEGVDRSNGTLVMATNATFEPYEYYEDQKVVGIDPDIAQAVCDVLGYDLKIEDMEFDAIVNAVVSGKDDFGAAGMTVKDERKPVSYTHLDVYKRQPLRMPAASAPLPGVTLAT